MRLITIILSCSFFQLNAQFAGYQSLHLPASARNAALGGKAVSLADGDINQFIHNPATLDSVDFTDISVTYCPYFAGVNQFIGNFHAPIERIGGVAVGLSYLDYGTFTESDPTGHQSGTFQGQDYVITIGKSHQLGSFSIGANLKFVNSSIESYGSSAIMADLGGIYHYPKGDFHVGLVLKNFGVRLNSFGVVQDHVPFDVQLGFSVKPRFMPFRFTVTAYNLTQENLVFRDNAVSSAALVEAFDDIFRRINLGTELILSKNIHLLIGYNHLRRQELSLEEKGAGAGFSYGFKVGIKRFELRYGRSIYHASGGANFFTLQSNINSFNKVL